MFKQYNVYNNPTYESNIQMKNIKRNDKLFPLNK